MRHFCHILILKWERNRSRFYVSHSANDEHLRDKCFDTKRKNKKYQLFPTSIKKTVAVQIKVSKHTTILHYVQGYRHSKDPDMGMRNNVLSTKNRTTI